MQRKLSPPRIATRPDLSAPTKFGYHVTNLPLAGAQRPALGGVHGRSPVFVISAWSFLQGMMTTDQHFADC